jgi:hypothetical protein
VRALPLPYTYFSANCVADVILSSIRSYSLTFPGNMNTKGWAEFLFRNSCVIRGLASMGLSFRETQSREIITAGEL